MEGKDRVMILPGKYEAKAETFLEFVKVLLWGSGWPFGLIGVCLLVVSLWFSWVVK